MTLVSPSYQPDYRPDMEHHIPKGGTPWFVSHIKDSRLGSADVCHAQNLSYLTHSFYITGRVTRLEPSHCILCSFSLVSH